jgi:hypothetical protein
MHRPYARPPISVTPASGDVLQAWCPHCRDRRQMVDAQSITFQNGRPALAGTCEVCGTAMRRLVPQRA